MFKWKAKIKIKKVVSEKDKEKESTRESIWNKGVKRQYKRPTFQVSELALSFKPTKCQKAMEWRERKGKLVGKTKCVLCPS